MRSVRLDPELEERIAAAAKLREETVSEFIRRAARERADATLVADPAVAFADVLGAVRAGGGAARRTGRAFAEVVEARHRRA